MFRKRFPPGSRSRAEPASASERPGPAAVTPAGPAVPAAAPRPLKDIVAPRRPRPSELTGSPGRVLVVGRDIVLSGEIATCEKLVIEGRVEGDILETKRLEIAETGRFKGRAEVQECVVAGACEGKLTVAGPLAVRAKGRVKGTVRYVEIEIQRGGRLSGVIDIQTVRDVTGPSRRANEPGAGSAAAAKSRPDDQRPDLKFSPGTGPRSG